MKIFAQAIGVVAAALVIWSFQQKEQKKVVLLQMLGQLLFTINYLLLGISVGAWLNGIAVVRGIVYFNRERFKAEKLIWLVVFGAAFLSVYVVTFAFGFKEPTLYNLLVDALPMTAMFLATVSFRSKEARVVRRLGIIASPMWMGYNIINFTIGGILCEGFNMVSIIIGIIRLDMKREAK